MMLSKQVSAETRITYSVFETPSGWGAAVAGPAGLTDVILPFGRGSKEEVLQGILVKSPGAAGADPGSAAAIASSLLERYFAGEQVSFAAIPVDDRPFTPFQKAVYRLVSGIGYGETMTYGEVAAGIGSPGAARGIGSAMARNPLPVIIPCHRVVGATGRMTGYSAPGGIDSKIFLLRLEGVVLSAQGTLPLRASIR